LFLTAEIGKTEVIFQENKANASIKNGKAYWYYVSGYSFGYNTYIGNIDLSNAEKADESYLG
jgi:hypothetical protein